MFHKLVFRKRPRKKVYLNMYLPNTPNTGDQIQIQIQIHGLKFDQIQIQIQIRRICICICICKYKYVFDPSPGNNVSHWLGTGLESALDVNSLSAKIHWNILSKIFLIISHSARHIQWHLGPGQVKLPVSWVSGFWQSFPLIFISWLEKYTDSYKLGKWKVLHTLSPQSTLVQVPIHYLSQCWPRSLSSVTCPLCFHCVSIIGVTCRMSTPCSLGHIIRQLGGPWIFVYQRHHTWMNLYHAYLMSKAFWQKCIETHR